MDCPFCQEPLSPADLQHAVEDTENKEYILTCPYCDEDIVFPMDHAGKILDPLIFPTA